MSLSSEQLKQDLVSEFGLEVLAPEKQNEIIEKMTDVLMKRVFVVTMEKLGEANMDEYEQFLASNPDPEKVEAFLVGKIPEYNEIVVKVVEEFKKEMKGEL